jgi:hypothetical protein
MPAILQAKTNGVDPLPENKNPAAVQMTSAGKLKS